MKLVACPEVITFPVPNRERWVSILVVDKKQPYIKIVWGMTPHKQNQNQILIH